MLRPLSACSRGVSRVQLYSLSLCNSSWLERATEGTDTVFGVPKISRRLVVSQSKLSTAQGA